MVARSKAGSTSKQARRATRAKAPSAASTVSAQAGARLKQLRETVEHLKARLQREAARRGADLAMLSDAKKARQALAGQFNALKRQGMRLSRELKKALSDSDRREKARQQALAKIGELRAELARKTGDLRRKSEELAKLACASAGRARDILRGEAPASAPAEAPAAREPFGEAGASGGSPGESGTSGGQAG